MPSFMVSRLFSVFYDYGAVRHQKIRNGLHRLFCNALRNQPLRSIGIGVSECRRLHPAMSFTARRTLYAAYTVIVFENGASSPPLTDDRPRVSSPVIAIEIFADFTCQLILSAHIRLPEPHGHAVVRAAACRAAAPLVTGFAHKKRAPHLYDTKRVFLILKRVCASTFRF